MERQIGKNTLHGGGKMKVETRHYERSTHDLSYIWRSTMASGTLVPFLKNVLLTADTFDIDLECEVLTHPTIGPLFGSYKVQLDIFKADVRLYQGKLHNNALNIGLNMASIKLPLVSLTAPDINFNLPPDNQQVNASCIFKYLGISGVGQASGSSGERIRRFNAVPYLAYWDIYKNYYANKQEPNGAVIHNTDVNRTVTLFKMQSPPAAEVTLTVLGEAGYGLNGATNGTVEYSGAAPSAKDLILNLVDGTRKLQVTLEEMFDTIVVLAGVINYLGLRQQYIRYEVNGWQYAEPDENRSPQIKFFPLENIDLMREDIFSAVKSTVAFEINSTSIEPYGLSLKKEGTIWSKATSQEGLALKTYQSDIFNNWIRTEWVTGAGSINAITAVSTAGGSFTIDTLTLARKVYNMLNAIAVSGGSYDDWLDVNWDEERYSKPETPVYMGGLSKELIFQEVVSTAASNEEGDQPLGTLAGRGKLSGKHKGGKIRVKASEIGYVMGIVSITPRIDYSQGNDWDGNIATMDDFHKPALDQIGFQDLITDQMAFWETTLTAGNPAASRVYRTAGKQPAWINYMTAYNKVYGGFAEQDNQMFMVLNRRYEANKTTKRIADLTTYIDPQKYNHIFAYTKRDAQNFWVQIGVNITARRKMSAKIMPQA
ncbi:MAG: major capsid protein [Malazfec virus 5]